MARGDGRVYLRGDRWWISYYVRGQRVRRPAGKDCKTERAARTALRAHLAEADRGEPAFHDEKLTCGDLLDRMVSNLKTKGKRSGLEKKACYGHVEPVREFFGMYRAVTVTSALVERYQRERLEKKKAAGTINRELGALRQAYRLAKKREEIRRVPHFEMLKEAPPRQGFFEPEEVKALALELGEPWGDAVRFAFRSCWRKSEVLGLTWEMADRKAAEIRLPRTKNGDGRTMPLVGEVARIIERRHRERLVGCPLVFHVRGKAIGMDFRRRWSKACEAIGQPGRLFHDLRRSGIRTLVRAGVPTSVVMRQSGHRTLAVMTRYDIASLIDQRSALERADEFVAASVARAENGHRTGTNEGSGSGEAG